MKENKKVSNLIAQKNINWFIKKEKTNFKSFFAMPCNQILIININIFSLTSAMHKKLKFFCKPVFEH